MISIEPPTRQVGGFFVYPHTEGDVNLDAYITRAEASLLTGVTADAIGKWHHRGWKTPDGCVRRLRTRPGPGRTLRYRVGDLLDAERDTRDSPNSRRGSTPLLAA
jgi:hypothetical protein